MARKSEQESPKMPVTYKYDDNYRVIPANGLYGGITPRGDLRIDFFVEYQDIPKQGEFAYEVQPDGSVKEVQKSKRKQFVRTMQVGVMIPGNQVPSFAQWFQDKVEKLKLTQAQIEEVQ